MNLKRGATGATAALTATDHSTMYPGGGASKKYHGGHKPNFATKSIGQVPRQPSEANENTEELEASMIAASPSLLRTWRFWASSAHPREAKSDSFLACAAKTKQRLAAAHTRPCTPSLSSTNVAVSLGLREMLHYIIPIAKKEKNIDNTLSLIHI